MYYCPLVKLVQRHTLRVINFDMPKQTNVVTFGKYIQ